MSTRVLNKWFLDALEGAGLLPIILDKNIILVTDKQMHVYWAYDKDSRKFYFTCPVCDTANIHFYDGMLICEKCKLVIEEEDILSLNKPSIKLKYQYKDRELEENLNV